MALAFKLFYTDHINIPLLLHHPLINVIEKEKNIAA
jgi:hypothetical protein